MMHSKLLILLLGLVSFGARAAGHVDSVSIEEAKRFLYQYAEQSYLQSAQFADLYSDRAVVRVHGQGQSTERRLLGRSYKRWLRDRLLARDIALDVSQFKEVRLERRGGRLIIQAHRYAANRCYSDPNYLVGLEREGGRWLIVDEAITTQPQAKCSPNRETAPPSAARKSGLVPSVNHSTIANSQAATFVPQGNSSPPLLPSSLLATNEVPTSQAALLAQRAAEARAIAQHLAASYGQGGTAASEANWAPQSSGGLSAVRPLGRLGTGIPSGAASSLWITPD